MVYLTYQINEVKRMRWKPICNECGSEDLIVDAILRWNVEQKTWAVYTESNITKCLNEECDNWEQDTYVDWIDLDENLPLFNTVQTLT
jgi:hypothetical protein